MTSVIPTVDYLQQGGAVAVPDPTYGAGASSQPRSWLEVRHPDYLTYNARWQYAIDHYSGECNTPQNVRHYLVKRITGESLPAFDERCRIADYTNHFAAVVDGLVGMLTAIEGDASRRFTNDDKVGLGDPGDPDTPIGSLWMNADGRRTPYLALFKNLASDITVMQKSWILVDGAGGQVRIRILPPTAVVNWREGENGQLVEALVLERADARESLAQQGRASFVDQYVHFTLDGWQRYRTTDKGDPVVMSGPNGSDTYSYVDRQGTPQLAIFPVDLPLRRLVGYQLARKCNAIFNKESERDYLLRVASFPKLNVHGNQESYNNVVAALTAGANTLHVPNDTPPHNYIVPPSESALIQTEVLKRKVEEFYVTAHREYSNTSAQRTATEARQDTAQGVAAFLELLRSSLDVAENEVLWRVEQFLSPNDARKHFIARVERSSDFSPLDADAFLDKQNARLFGPNKATPVGYAAQLEAAKETVKHQGFSVDAEQIGAAVRSCAILYAMTEKPDLQLPAGAMAALAIDVLTAAGYLTPENDELITGEFDKRKAAWTAEAQQLAASAAEAANRQSQNFPGTGNPTTDTTGGDAVYEVTNNDANGSTIIKKRHQPQGA